MQDASLHPLPLMFLIIIMSKEERPQENTRTEGFSARIGHYGVVVIFHHGEDVHPQLSTRIEGFLPGLGIMGWR